MSRLRVLLSRIAALFRGRQLDRDLREQIASHLDEAADEYMRQGLSAEDARRAALRSFGGVTRTEEAWRDARSFASLDHLRRDVRHAARSLRRGAGFSLVVMLVLAIGTGAVTAVFALLNAVVLRPLPFPESDRLVVIKHSAPGLGLDDAGVSSGLYFHYLKHVQSFASLAVYREPQVMNLRTQEDKAAEQVRVAYASAALFTVLRTRPALGRLFTEDDGRPGFMNMTWRIPVLLAHDFWVDRFGADPGIAGRTLTIGNSAREVVGVLPQGFAFPRADTQMWMLLEPAPPKRADELAASGNWAVLARLRSGASVASTGAELTTTLQGLESVSPSLAKAGLSAEVLPLKSVVVGDVAHVIWLLFAGMAFLLLVACANAAGLFLVRAEHRAPEMAVRRALGAHGPHLARLFFTEALLLTGAAAALGLLIANGIVSAVVAFPPFELPRTAEIRLDGRAVAFAAAVAVLMAAFYGGLCARRQTDSQNASLLSRGRWSTGGRRGLRGPDLLIAFQVALALTLMTGSALMVKTYRNLSQRDLGFVPADVLTIEIGLPGRKASQHARIYRELVERVGGIPGVDHASAASFVPLTASEHLYPLSAGAPPVLFKFVMPGYFQTMGTRIVDGERLIADEPLMTPNPVFVSAVLARRLYPGERAVGKMIRRLNENGTAVDIGSVIVPPFTIAGIVADVREMTLRESATEIVYIPVTEPPVERSLMPTRMRLVVRARVPLPSLATPVREAIASVDRDVSVGQVRTMSAIVGAARAREAFVGALLLAAAGVSLLLGAIGIYGSVAQVARRRTREIAIRMALGASRGDVMRMVTTGSLRAALLGAAFGLALSLPAARLLDSLLFGVEAHDPIVFGAVTASLILAAAAAALLAARHAARVPPLEALRGE